MDNAIKGVHHLTRELGYCDQRFFSTAFKKRFGMYPLAWRNTYR